MRLTSLLIKDAMFMDGSNVFLATVDFRLVDETGDFSTQVTVRPSVRVDRDTAAYSQIEDRILERSILDLKAILQLTEAQSLSSLRAQIAARQTLRLDLGEGPVAD